jgi:hypothetical protein
LIWQKTKLAIAIFCFTNCFCFVMISKRENTKEFWPELRCAHVTEGSVKQADWH